MLHLEPSPAEPDVTEALLTALVFAEDVLSRFPFSGKFWIYGNDIAIHPNAGISIIRAALSRAGAPQ